MMKHLSRLGAAYLLLLAGFVAGAYVVENKLWPYSAWAEIVSFVKGHPEEKTDLAEKIRNDLNLSPERHIGKYPSRQDRAYRQVRLPGANERRQSPLLFRKAGAAPGYRLVYGVFDFAEHLHGAILIDPTGKIVHTWQVTQDHLEWQHRPDLNVRPHSFDIRRDGSLLIELDWGTALQRIDVCSRLVWAKMKRRRPGENVNALADFHHSIAAEGPRHVWTWRDDYLIKVDVENGKTVREFPLLDIWRTNPNIDIMGLRQKETETSWEWAFDPFHPNDIEPLSAEMADAFPRFDAGDLLVSLRNINLVFVVDPDTLKIKWWRIGQWRRQHDPDWLPDGRIAVYDNNMHRKPSRIVAISPETYEAEVLVDGTDFDFYSSARGKQQHLSNGNILITSAYQGRAFEVTDNGEVVFEFLNIFDQAKNEVLVVSEARYLPLDFFEFEEFPKCD